MKEMLVDEALVVRTLRLRSGLTQLPDHGPRGVDGHGIPRVGVRVTYRVIGTSELETRSKQ